MGTERDHIHEALSGLECRRVLGLGKRKVGQKVLLEASAGMRREGGGWEEGVGRKAFTMGRVCGMGLWS